MKKIVFASVGLVLIGVAVFFIYGRPGEEGLRVKAATVEYGAVSSSITAAGSVINREELSVSSPVAAQLVNVLSNEGDFVRQGQVLATSDERESQLQIEKAAAAHELASQNALAAKRDWERLEQVFLVGGEARNTVDEAKLRYETMRMDVRVSQQELSQAKLQHQKLRVIAPVNGLIVARLARPGTWIKAGDTMFRLAPTGMHEIEVKLDAGDSAGLAVGNDVSVTSDAFPGREWMEKIKWVAPMTNKDGAANSLSVRVSLGPDAPKLVLGQQADVKIITASADRALRIPSSAIVSRQGKSMVAVAEKNSIRFAPITTGIEGISVTEIKTGLVLGQKVVLLEGKVFREGEKITLAIDVDAQ